MNTKATTTKAIMSIATNTKSIRVFFEVACAGAAEVLLKASGNIGAVDDTPADGTDADDTCADDDTGAVEDARAAGNTCAVDGTCAAGKRGVLLAPQLVQKVDPPGNSNPHVLQLAILLIPKKS